MRLYRLGEDNHEESIQFVPCSDCTRSRNTAGEHSLQTARAPRRLFKTIAVIRRSSDRAVAQPLTMEHQATWSIRLRVDGTADPAGLQHPIFIKLIILSCKVIRSVEYPNQTQSL